jgi:hypothetical protein
MIIHADEVAQLIRDQTKAATDYAVIDVRRNDHGVSEHLSSTGTRQSIDLPLPTRGDTSAEVTNVMLKHSIMNFPLSLRSSGILNK